MRILAVGDVVGPEAARWLADRIPLLRSEHSLDWVVVNAENCAVTGPSPMNGFGITTEVLQILIEGGVDAVTGGNHSWDGPDVDAVLAHPRVVRPGNLAETRGRGVLTLQKEGSVLTVVNLLSQTAALPAMNAPQPLPLWPAWQQLRDSGELTGAVLIDLHGESAWEKASFVSAIDGEVTALVGTHTHDPTARGHVLPGGTGYVTELGMTGRLGFTGGGFDPVHFAYAFRGEDVSVLPPYELATGPLVLGAIVLEVSETGRTTSITRLS